MTDQRELEVRIKALHKAQAEKEAPASIIALLEGLKKDFRPTEEMLRVCTLPAALRRVIFRV
jgi:transcription elongation factor S-II